ncbi:hypothetical protein PUN28_011281 [Cardiocondyla obscurior]|uniref:Bee-milk protein n=1 Tax=Cardiocondyla obscurior TaxID=286306 RepID=A0AAW2FHG7_9HYME
MKYLLLILVSAIVALGDVKLNVVFKWNYANFTWESREQMQAAVDSGNYSPLRSLMYDATKADDGRVFITLPKEFGPGTPATLATVSNIEGPGGLLLSPYPDWSWHNSNCTCNRFTNIHRVDIKCNHLFVLDNGKIGLNQICNPKLLIFRLTDNTLVKTIYIPIDIATNLIGSGLLNTPLIYVPGGCSQILNEMIIFIADMQGYGLIVYDSSTKRMCRVESDYMRPTDGFVSIANDNFTYINGIFSMTTLYDDLFYAPVSGKEIYKINIKTLLTCPDKEQANAENKFMIKLSSQSGQITSAGHAILYSDSQAISLLGTNVYEKSDKNTVRFLFFTYNLIKNINVVSD